MSYVRLFFGNILHPQYCFADNHLAGGLVALLAAPIGHRRLLEEKAGARGGHVDGWAVGQGRRAGGQVGKRTAGEVGTPMVQAGGRAGGAGGGLAPSFRRP